MNEGEESTGLESKAEVISFHRAARDIGRYRFQIEEGTDGKTVLYYVSFKEGLWGTRRWVRYLSFSAQTFTSSTDEYYFTSRREANRALGWAHDYAARQIADKRSERMKKKRTVIHQEP